MKKLILSLLTAASISTYAEEPWVIFCSYDEFTSEHVQLNMLINRLENGSLTCEIYTYDWHIWGEDSIKSYYTVPCVLDYNGVDKSYAVVDLSKKKRLKGKVYAESSTLKLSSESGINEGIDAFTYKGIIDTGLRKVSSFKRKDARCKFYKRP